MAAITINPTTVSPPINLASGSTVTLRGFYSERFLDSNGTLVVMSGNGISGFYYEWDCTVDGNGDIVIPSMVIRTTNGIDIRTSRFTGQLFIDENPSIIIFGFPTGPGWIIPESLGSPTTWDDLDVFNQGQVQLTNISAQTTLSADAIVALIDSVPQGYSGFSGFSGHSGYSGLSGPSGTFGHSGQSGYSGFSGKSGYSGYSGSGISGYSGFTGKSGYSGFSSASGYSGFTGISGYSGNASGYSGFSGPSGYSGYSGDNPGSSGYSGFTGKSGYSGYSGSGYSGYSGLGTSGYSGFSGGSGYSGFSSTSGYSGFSSAVAGTSGYSGFSGAGGGGAGTVTVVGSGNLTSTAIVTGGGMQLAQTPSVTSTLSSGGDLVLVGSLTTGLGGGIGGVALTAGTFADLPGAPAQGAIATITDANTATWGATVSSGGGGNEVLIWFNGTNWTVIGA